MPHTLHRNAHDLHCVRAERRPLHTKLRNRVGTGGWLACRFEILNHFTKQVMTFCICISRRFFTETNEKCCTTLQSAREGMHMKKCFEFSRYQSSRTVHRHNESVFVCTRGVLYAMFSGKIQSDANANRSMLLAVRKGAARSCNSMNFTSGFRAAFTPTVEPISHLESKRI